MDVVIESLNGAPRSIHVTAPLVVIAGFTGRTASAVREHIRELDELGVPLPVQTPTFFTVPNWTLTQARDGIDVATDSASGEAEPVLVAMPDGRCYLMVGSDHTDRELERSSIELAKLTQPKVIGRTAWPLEEVEADWDQLLLRSWIGDDAELYQEDRLEALARPLDLLEQIRGRLGPPRDRPVAAFLGTVPLRQGSFRFDRAFTAAIEDEARGRRLVCSYSVDPIGAARLAEA